MAQCYHPSAIASQAAELENAIMTHPAAVAILLFTGLAPARAADHPGPADWRPLFDGRSLAGWRESDFFGAARVTVENGAITIGSGALTGISWAGETLPFPASGYEVRIEAARVKGGDFFAGITFPVRDSYCTWIVGGWGGEVVGLSSIDGADASRNQTTVGIRFEPGRWYVLRLRVTPSIITAWIDDDPVIDFTIGKHRLSLRDSEMDHALPFGIATYNTVGAVRKIEWRPAADAPPRPKD
jgi:hypothetical protein